MKLLVQPADGVMPLVKAIDRAKESVEILIFRFDQGEVERALLKAVTRGVRVRALIAYTNRGGERNLRDLELRLLAAGITVARTDNDLVRYHGKMIIVDRRELYVLALNFTFLDIYRSRSFGVVIKDPKLVSEAVKLFEADSQRQNYTPGNANFVVSPLNARKELAAFIQAAKRELLIYDPSVSDREMLRLLDQRAKAGVTIRVIGRVGKQAVLPARKLANVRLHTRLMVRDGSAVFIGSQSLRAMELDTRREIGVMFEDAQTAKRLAKIFNQDWQQGAQRSAAARTEQTVPAAKIAKKVAKAMTDGLPPIAPVVEDLVKKVAGNGVDIELDSAGLQSTVKDAVKNAVKDAVREVFEHAQPGESAKLP
jgi:cardiolipin synthase